MTPRLEGKRIILRPPRMSDVDDIYYQIKFRSISKYLSSVPFPYKRKDAVDFVKLLGKAKRKKTAFHFGIILKDSGEYIGGIGFVHIDRKNKNAELGYWLGSKYWGQGIATEAVKTMLDYGFRELKLHRIYANVFEENKSSARVLKKSKFRIEGRLREKWFKYGRWHDVLLFSILSREYKIPQK